jgi:excisionase family DNA binding protein
LALGIRRDLLNLGVLAAAIARNPPPAEEPPVDRKEEPMMDSRLARVIDTKLLTYTVEQAARLLGVSMGVAYQLVRDGVIPAHRIGRRWLIPRKALHAWLDNAPVG